MSKSRAIDFFSEKTLARKRVVYQCWTGKLKGTISRGTDVETNKTFVNQEEKIDLKIRQLSLKKLWCFSEKSQVNFFCS